MPNQFYLQLLTLRWLDTLPAEEDRCAHGKVEVRIGETMVSDASGEEWTVSAAALYLLRTLTQSHTPESPVGDQLLPCCGFAMWPDDSTENVFICGCPNGLNWRVEHEQTNVRLTPDNGPAITIATENYQAQILAFADQVEQFYRTSAPKQVPDDADDARGYELFWAEWHRRRNQWTR